MSRRLNIERRRKRIRHYTAKRRRRSPVHRAILFWWGTVLLLTATAILFGLIFALRNLGRPGEGAASRWLLPPAGLQLIYASEAEVAEALRMGNARRSARAMSDADIGISFAMRLPEPERLKLKPLPPLPESLRVLRPARPAAANLPPLAGTPAQPAGAETVTLRTERTLTEAGYAPQIRQQPEKDERGSAVFSVYLDDSGRALHVFRLSPAGDETPWLKAVRLALLQTRGTAAASGRVTIIWNTKDLP